MNSTILFRRAAMLLSAMLLSCTVGFAQNDEENLNKTLSPYFVVVSDNPEQDNLPLKETSVDANIVGSIADVTVRQVYVNSGKNPIEAIYTFPLSTRAAVYGMQMRIGKRLVRAQIEEKKKARADYEKAKQEGKRASLLEQSRPNVFTMNVSNVMVGDTIEVELKYTELIVPEKGTYSFVYPTVVGPRYSKTSKSNQNTGDSFVETPYTKAGTMPTYRFGYKVQISSAVPIQDITCTSHKMDIRHAGTGRATVTLSPAEVQGGNRDVVLNYSLQGNKIESGMLFYEGQDENFFLCMVQPPKRVAKEEIPPREYIFIVDVSGSMNGFPLDLTKKLMRNLILGLNPTDRFNVILFSFAQEQMSPQSVTATKENVEKAIHFIDNQRGSGSTEVLGALQMAFSIPRADEDVSRSFVIVTDGYVDVEQQCFDLIRLNSGETNFFAIGIGSSVNRYLIEGMAFCGGGEPLIVTKESEAAAQAERFRSFISTPVLTRITFDAGRFQAYDIEPVSVPDMMAERPILIFGKYKGKPQGTVTLTGKVGRKPFRQTFDLSKAKAEKDNSALRYLWARERIKYLTYSETQPYEETYGEGAKKILALGLKYNLMTNYTSFVAIDEEIVNKGGKQTTVKQAVPLPEGVSDYAIGADVPVLSLSKTASIGGIYVEEEVEEGVFLVVEDDPEFPGGLDSLTRFIKAHLRYPQEALEKGIEGRVYVTFTIEEDGSVSNVRLLRDIGGGCGAEAVRVVKLMPKWKPGRQRGKAVRTQFNLPVQFVIPKDK